MLVLEGRRAKLLEMDAATRAFRPAHAFADASAAGATDPRGGPSTATLLAELERGLAEKAFWRLVVVAEARRLEELTVRMSSDLRAAVSMQCAHAELELPADEVEARFRRLRSALPFVA
jgi:hypothetical protein